MKTLFFSVVLALSALHATNAQAPMCPEVSLPVNMIEDNFFMSGSEWSEAKQKQWFAFYANEDKASLVATKLKAKRDYDDMGCTKGWRLSSGQKTSPFLLFSGDVLKANPDIKTVSAAALNQSDAVIFNNMTYSVHFSVGETVEDTANGMSITYDFVMELVVKDAAGKEQRQTLTVYDELMGEATPSVLFAGDIDGDGKLDLLIDATNHPLNYMPTLFLSGAATDGDFLQLVGEEAWGGC